jgi:signal transduction histidine kinase/HAMP domain-containing protein
MSLKTRLTLWSVVVMTLMVGTISAIDFSNQIRQEFEGALERADLLKRVVVDMVVRSLEREPNLPIREALSRDPRLEAQLVDILSAAPALLEISISDRNNRILLASAPERAGETYVPYPDFRPVVREQSWLGKLRALRDDRSNFQLEEALGLEGEDAAMLYVRVIISPALIRRQIDPILWSRAELGLLTIAGAVIIALAFSTVAFRPLGKLGQMLDLLAKGDYDPQPIPPSEAPADEFGVMASKVSLLGQQLRGAKFDFSDLRGNFERLLEDLEDAVLVFGRDRRLMLASGAVEKFLGRSRSDLMGLTLAEIFPPTTSLGLLLAQAAQTGRAVRDRRVPIAHASSGPRPPVALLTVDILESLNSASPSAGPSNAMLVRLRDPEATRQIGRQLQTADRLSAISRITGGVAHEVKNPLNAILMHVELARIKLSRQDYDLEPQIETITREIRRLDRVVKTFLDFTRPVELNLAEISLDDFVKEIVELARPQADAAGIKVEVEQNTRGAHIRVDADLLKQAILNIVVNAIEAMPQGGSLRFQSSLAGDEAEIRISDTGPGIPPELRDKIFKLYFSTKPQGSGIGLAMTFRIVQLHDGTIDFTSEPGKGTAFSLRLPTLM